MFEWLSEHSTKDKDDDKGDQKRASPAEAKQSKPKKKKQSKRAQRGKAVIPQLLLPLVRKNGLLTQELPFEFSKWQSGKRLLFTRTGHDPEPCQLCAPIALRSTLS